MYRISLYIILATLGFSLFALHTWTGIFTEYQGDKFKWLITKRMLPDVSIRMVNQTKSPAESVVASQSMSSSSSEINSTYDQTTLENLSSSLRPLTVSVFHNITSPAPPGLTAFTSSSFMTEEKAKSACDPSITRFFITEETFQQISNISYVYSAYFDGRTENESAVRVMGVAVLKVSIYCHLWFNFSRKPVVVKAEPYVLKHFE